MRRLLAVSMGVAIAVAIIVLVMSQATVTLRCPPAFKTLSDLVVIDDALESRRQDQGRWPDSLEALVTPDEQGRRYLHVTGVPRDFWGRPYRLVPTRHGPLVFTLGADGEPRGDATDGDRASWWRLTGGRDD